MCRGAAAEAGNSGSCGRRGFRRRLLQPARVDGGRRWWCRGGGCTYDWERLALLVPEWVEPVAVAGVR